MNKPAEVYRLFNDAGELLYVGCSYSAANRAAEHKASVSWWSEVARTEVETFVSREDALRAEGDAIKTERPRYNIQHGGPGASTRRYLRPTPVWDPQRNKISLATHTELIQAAHDLRVNNEERDRLIVKLRSEGLSLRRIADEMDLSHSAIRRILIINKEKGAT